MTEKQGETLCSFGPGKDSLSQQAIVPSENTSWDSNRKGKQSQNMQKEKYKIFLS